MRKSLMFVGIPFAVVGVAVAVAVGLRGSQKKSADSLTDDLARAQAAGLELAQAQGATKFALSETVPESKPEPSKAIKKGSGTKAVRSTTPTVKAAPTTVAADVVEEIPEMPVMQTASAPSPVEAAAPAVPRPVPVTTVSYPEQDQGPILAGGTGRGTGTAGNGGNGGGWGGIFGAVIRGGGVDGDNCDPRPRSGGSRRPGVGGVYGANPSGSMAGMGTPINSRAPVMPRMGVPSRPRGGR